MPSSKKHAPKTVFDANVWISALLWGGKPAQIVEAAEKGQLTILLSEQMLTEISQVLNYPRIACIYRAAGLRHQDLMEAVFKTAKLVSTTRKVNAVKEHPADNKIIECALAAHAQTIVSGDKHLLKLGSYQKIRIVSVEEFLQILKAK